MLPDFLMTTAAACRRAAADAGSGHRLRAAPSARITLVGGLIVSQMLRSSPTGDLFALAGSAAGWPGTCPRADEERKATRPRQPDVNAMNSRPLHPPSGGGRPLPDRLGITLAGAGSPFFRCRWRRCRKSISPPFECGELPRRQPRKVMGRAAWPTPLERHRDKIAMLPR